MEDKLAKLPRGWAWTEIGNIGEIITGTTPSKSINEYYGKDFPFYKPTDLNEGYYVRKSEDGLSKKGINKGRLLPAKSILVTCIGATIGKTGFIRKAGASNQQINAIIPKRGVVPEYIFFSCISPQIQKSIINNASSTTLPILNKTKFEKLSIPIPPFPEQNRIVFKIEELFAKLDAGVEALKKVKAQLKRYRQAVLKYAFEGKLTQEWREANKDKLEPASVLLERIKEERKKDAKGKFKELSPLDTSDLSELPEGWAWTRVGDIGNVLGGKRVPKGHDYSETPTNHPYIRVTDFENHSINMSNLVFLKPETHKIIQKYTISKKDVYISIAGSIGKVGVIPQRLNGANLTENAAKITDMMEVGNKYLSYALNSAFSQEQISRLTISTNQPKLALFRIEQIIIPLASTIEQQKVVEEIEIRLSMADEVEKVAEQTLTQSDRLRQSILKQAFEGKLIPQDPTDEPAEKLLERIKAEKAEKGTETKIRRKRSNEMELK